VGYREPTTREQALAEALYLELVAGGDEGKRAACRLLVDAYSAGLDPAVVEICRAHARERYEAEPESPS
jgi:Fe-S-cluster-containing dehydrogenase component